MALWITKLKTKQDCERKLTDLNIIRASYVRHLDHAKSPADKHEARQLIDSLDRKRNIVRNRLREYADQEAGRLPGLDRPDDEPAAPRRYVRRDGLDGLTEEELSEARRILEDITIPGCRSRLELLKSKMKGREIVPVYMLNGRHADLQDAIEDHAAIVALLAQDWELAEATGIVQEV